MLWKGTRMLVYVSGPQCSWQYFWLLSQLTFITVANTCNLSFSVHPVFIPLLPAAITLSHMPLLWVLISLQSFIVMFWFLPNSPPSSVYSMIINMVNVSWIARLKNLQCLLLSLEFKLNAQCSTGSVCMLPIWYPCLCSDCPSHGLAWLLSTHQPQPTAG